MFFVALNPRSITNVRKTCVLVYVIRKSRFLCLLDDLVRILFFSFVDHGFGNDLFPTATFILLSVSNGVVFVCEYLCVCSDQTKRVHNFPPDCALQLIQISIFYEKLNYANHTQLPNKFPQKNYWNTITIRLTNVYFCTWFGSSRRKIVTHTNTR